MLEQSRAVSEENPLLLADVAYCQVKLANARVGKQPPLGSERQSAAQDICWPGINT
jgi:hypothetical protein